MALAATLMASEEYLLARLSAHSAGLEPRMPSGFASFSHEDILMATGAITDIRSYHCIHAAWLGDDMSLGEVEQFSLHWSWSEWRRLRRYPNVSVGLHDRIVERAILDWLLPNNKPSESGRARFLRRAVKTVASNYAAHLNYVANNLSTLELSARLEMRLFLFGN